MSLATVLIAAAAMAVNFGWQEYDDGYEYLVQLEPETLRLLQDEGEVPIDSHVPKDVQPIRRIRIVVGRAELPRETFSENDELQSDEAVERSAYFRPEESAPPANNRYPAQSAAPTSTLDKIVQPLRDVDNYLEGGFEAGIDSLENTGQAIRGAVGNLGGGVQQQLQRTKETLVGPSPDSGTPATNPPINYNGVAPAPVYGNAPTLRSDTGANAGNLTSPLRDLPPPPLTDSDPADSTIANPNLAGDAPPNGPVIPDNREGTARDTRGFSATVPSSDANNRMVPVDPIGSASSSAVEEPPAWAPWPVSTSAALPEPSTPSTGWPTATSPASDAPAQPVATTGNRPTTTDEPAAIETEPNTSASTPDGQSLTGWLLALIGLAGSIGCNFFLGVSYLDIRNKYRAALRRTSRSFGRPATSV